MSLRIFLAVLIVIVPMQATAADIAKETIVIDGRDRTYYVYVPENAGPNPPILVLLHGSYERGLNVARLWRDLADREGVVLLAPVSLHVEGWNVTNDKPDFINAAVTTVASNRPIDLRRIYLFGQSGGAVYALTLAMLESEYFAAASVHAGAWKTRAEFDLTTVAARKIPMRIEIGDRDEFFSLSEVHNTERALRQADFPIEVSVVEDQHHWFNTVTAPRIDAAAWEFLKPHHLDQAPKFVVYRQ